MTSITRKDWVTLPSVSELAKHFFWKPNVERLDLDTALEIIKRRFIFESSEIIENAKHENNAKEARKRLELKIKRTLERAAKFDIFEEMP